MSLVGILTEKSNENYIKDQLKNELKEDQTFFLKETTIKNLKNIKFETIVIGKKINKNKKIIRQMAQKADFVIFNTDIIENLKLLENLNFKLISYGFNQKATITASSIEESKIMICLQRTIQNINQKRVEPQEVSMQITENINSYAVMELLALKLIYGL